MLMSGQVIGYPCRRLYPYADGLRISKPPLPVRGSWVLVNFPGGDIRNGTVMGAYHPNLVDPIPNPQNADPFSSYESHYSGHWSYMNSTSGHLAMQFADRSYLVVSSGTALPTMYRHAVTSGQTQQRVEFTDKDRNPNPQKPFAVTWQQATSGQIGGLNVSMDASGNFTLSNAVTGKTCTVKFNGTTLTIDASGNYHVDLVSGKNLDITQGGASPTNFLTLVSKLVAAFNSHKHTNVMTGGDETGTPADQWTSDTVKSAIINISG